MGGACSLGTDCPVQAQACLWRGSVLRLDEAKRKCSSRHQKEVPLVRMAKRFCHALLRIHKGGLALSERKIRAVALDRQFVMVPRRAAVGFTQAPILQKITMCASRCRFRRRCRCMEGSQADHGSACLAGCVIHWIPVAWRSSRDHRSHRMKTFKCGYRISAGSTCSGRPIR